MHCYHNYLNIPAQLVHKEDVSITVVKIHKSFAGISNIKSCDRSKSFDIFEPQDWKICHVNIVTMS